MALNDPLYATPINTTLTISSVGSGLRNNDFDADGDTLSLSVVTGPAHGSLSTFNTNGTFTYVPTTSYTGLDTFTYKANDGGADSNVATVTIAVGGSFGPRTNLDEIPAGGMLLTGANELWQPLTMGDSLVYNSSTVNPQALVAIDTSLVSSSAVPDSIDAELTFNSVSQGTVSYDTTGLSAGDPLRFVLQADASGLSTGYYNYSVTLTAWFSSTPVTRTYSGSQAVVNRTSSPFGEGWWLEGLDQLVASGSGALLVQGCGDTLWFASDGAGGYVKAAGDLDNSTLVKNVDNTFTLTSKYGIETNFGTTGLLTSVVDTNGNEVDYGYTTGKLTSITDPFSRTTDLTYSSGKLVTFEDLANRDTTLAYDGAQLSTVTLPDPDAGGALAAPVYTFGYDGTSELLNAAINPLTDETDYSYSASQRLTTITYPNSATWNLTAIDTIGLASGSGNALTSPADAVGAITDERGKDWHFTTDRYGNLTTWSDPLSNTTQYERDADGRVFRLTEADPDGAGVTYTSPVTKYGYTAAGDLAKEVLPDNNTRTYTWNGLSRMLTLTDERSKTWTNTFDAYGNLETSNDPYSNETSYLYTMRGQVRSITTPDPDAGGAQTAATTEIDYDAYGRVETITNADASTQAFAYNTADQLTTYTDELDHDWTQTWDALDRRTSTTNPESETRTFKYDAASQLIETDDALANDTLYAYNNRGWLLHVYTPDPDGAGTDYGRSGYYYTYDAAGNVTYEGDDPWNEEWDPTYAYDDAGRLTSARQPGTAQFSTLELDNLGRVKKRTESNGDVDRYTKYTYNARSRVTSTIQSDPTASPLEDGPTTSFTYDASGHTLTLTDPDNNTTTWTYDDVGRVTGEENELEDSRSFAYDDAGRLKEKTDRLGRTTKYLYNERNWVTDEKWYDGVTLVRTLSYDRDVAGNLTGASDPTATYAFGFDDANRVTSETQTLAALSFDIEYDSVLNDNGLRTRLSAILDGTADFQNDISFDNTSRVTQITQQDAVSGNTVADKRIDFTYNSYGNVDRLVRYASLDTSEHVVSSFFDYDEFSRVTSIIHTTDTSPPETGWGTGVLAGYVVDWDAGNRVTSVDSYADGLSSFSYDNWDQLLAADHASQTDESYSFDDNGNRTGGSYDTDPNNQLVSDGVYNYTYDAEGNRLTRTKISNGYVTQYGWDYRNRLVSITEKNNSNVTLSTVAYAYDVFDQRISKSVDSDGPGGSAAVLTVFSWESGQVNLQFDGDDPGDLTHRYLWNPAAIDQILADEAVTALNAAGSVLWPLADHQGTIRDLASYDSGLDETDIANHRVFNTFGNLISETDSGVDHLFAWTGAQRDDESGMQYHRARYYDPVAGKWISEDPIEFAAGDPNLARIVGNSPASLVDITGHDQQSGAGTAAFDSDACSCADGEQEQKVEDPTKEKKLMRGSDENPSFPLPKRLQIKKIPTEIEIGQGGIEEVIKGAGLKFNLTDPIVKLLKRIFRIEEPIRARPPERHSMDISPAPIVRVPAPPQLPQIELGPGGLRRLPPITPVPTRIILVDPIPLP